MEKFFHDQYAEHRTDGEWFNLPRDDAVELDQTLLCWGVVSVDL
jgi:hypothetical protein